MPKAPLACQRYGRVLRIPTPTVFAVGDVNVYVILPDGGRGGPILIDTGVRKLVFVRTDAERFEPREVQLGARAEARFAVLSGLREGEQVVTSANFLIDAESRLRAAVEKKSGAPGGHSSHGAQ